MQSPSSSTLSAMARLLDLLSVLVFAVAACYAGEPAGLVYWNKVLPNTPMPRAIKDLLTPHFTEDKYQFTIQQDVRIYNHAATKTQLQNDPSVALFFLEKDLQPGTKMTLHFTPTTSGAAFISRREANSVPFSSTEFPQILSHFSVDPNSAEAKAMKSTLTVCEEPPITGESKYCATSLESMVEFCTLSLGTRKVAAASTTVDKQNSPKQQYTIQPSGVKKLSWSNNLVVCHAQSYAYAVFYCHTIRSTRAYQVSMAGEDGTKVEAVAVCHADTSGWNPKHIALQVLGVKPGGVPICHFQPQDHVVWSPKK